MADEYLFAFSTDIDTMLEFYQRCIDEKADTKEERLKILIEMTKEQKIDSVSMTKRSREQYIKDLRKEFNVFDAGEVG